MRESFDTDRTQVDSSVPAHTAEHLDTLTEQRTRMSELEQKASQQSRRHYGDRFDDNDNDNAVLGDGQESAVSESAEERDLEKGDEHADNEMARQKSRPSTRHDPNLVEWDGPNDPENPMNWSVRKKWIITLAFGFTTFCVTFASSVFSNAAVPVAELYDVSREVTTLASSIFVFGFAVGPLIWGPGSEIFGRKRPLFFGYFCFAVLQIPVAVAQNIYTIIICRFIGGIFASAPLAIVGGALADFWGPVDRGVAVCVFASATFLGPVMGPIMGGFITQSYLGWRWTAWITLIMAAFFGTIGLFIIPESSHPQILQNRAKRLRFETKNWAIHSQRDTVQIDLNSLFHTYGFRPFIMLFQEPILLLLTLYMALIYGILYLFFLAVPISFQEHRGWRQGVGALPFIGIGFGVLIGVLTIVCVTKTRFARKLAKHGRVIPEERLPPMILGAFILPIGLFWFAWTSSTSVSWVAQVISGVPIGCGILMIFLQGLNYLIDVYMWHANSALAANACGRSLAGGGFPLFATAMYHTMGVDWATSLLGFLCVAMIPAPICFFFYGARIRKMSKFSPST